MKKFIIILAIHLMTQGAKGQLIQFKASAFEPTLFSKTTLNDEFTGIAFLEKLSNIKGFSLQATYNIRLSEVFFVGLDVKFTNTHQQINRALYDNNNVRVIFEKNLLNIYQGSIAPQLLFIRRNWYYSSAFGPQINWHRFVQGTAKDLRFVTTKDLTKTELKPTANMVLSVDVGYLNQLSDEINFTFGVQYVKNFTDKIVKDYYQISYQHLSLTAGLIIDINQYKLNK